MITECNAPNRTGDTSITAYRLITLFFAFAFLYMTNISVSYAGVMCAGIVTMLAGDTAQAISTLGVLGIGIGATFGKATWGMATLTAVGIATINGCALIANTFGAGYGC
jgi:type IV secretory pathway VirB2 component (pilin)